MPQEIDPQKVSAEIRQTVEKLRSDVAELEKKLRSVDANVSRQADGALRQITTALKKIAVMSDEGF